MYRILIVDDEAQERSGIKYLIEKYEFPLNIHEAPNGLKAYEYLKNHQIDILFTDVKMPYMDGLELAKKTWEYSSKIKIVIFSAFSDFQYAKKAMEAHALNYLLKPIDIPEFKKVMERIISECDREKLQTQKQFHLLSRDKKMMWLNIITGRLEADNSLLTRLKELNYQLENHCFVLMLIETLSSYFASNEIYFKNLLESSIPYDYEYVSIYPNTAHILLYRKSKFKKVELKTLAKKIQTQIYYTSKSPVSIFIGNPVFSLSEISTEAKRNSKIQANMFGWEQQINFTSDLVEPEVRDYENIEMHRNLIMTSIRNKKVNDIITHSETFLNYLSSKNVVSISFIHSEFSNYITEIYSVFGFNINHVVQKQIYKLSECKKKEDILLLISTICSSVSAEKGAENIDTIKVVKKIKWIINAEYQNTLSLDYLAEQVGLTPSYISYIFKREVGINLIKYITDFRMQKAKSMLDEGKYKIVQIAKACGYENPSYFNKLFKTHFLITPSQYKNKEDFDA